MREVTCSVRRCQRIAREEYEWFTPEGTKTKWFCDRHKEFAQLSRNSNRVSQ